MRGCFLGQQSPDSGPVICFTSGFWAGVFNEGPDSASSEPRRSATQTKQALALRKWNPSDLPNWRDEDCYRREILPRLSKFTVKKIHGHVDSVDVGHAAGRVCTTAIKARGSRADCTV